ncbi:MAG: alpha/beta fold hydrolase [Streptosporangiales bacterium]
MEAIVRESVPPVWPGTYMQAGDVPMYVRHAPAESSDAEPGVFVHGLGGGSSTWTDLMNVLRDRIDGYAPDLPGFGSSPPPSRAAYSVTAQAEAVVALIEHTGVPVHLFGNSVGGAVAVRVAAERPQLVRTLTLTSPALPDLRPRPALAGLLAPLVPGVGSMVLRQAGRRTPDEQARLVLNGLAGNPARIHPQRVADTAAEIAVAADCPHLRDAYMGALRGIVADYLRRGPGGLWPAAGQVRAPTLIVYGAADPMVDARHAARAARAFRGSRVLVLGGVGHLAQLEEPRVVANAFRTLVAPHG